MMWGSGVYLCGSVCRTSFTAAWSPHEYEIGFKSRRGSKSTLLVTQSCVMRKSVVFQTNKRTSSQFAALCNRNNCYTKPLLLVFCHEINGINIKVRPSYMCWLTACRIRYAKKPAVQTVMRSPYSTDWQVTHVLLFMSRITFRGKGIFNTACLKFETKHTRSFTLIT